MSGRRRIAWMAHPLSAPTKEGIKENIARAKRWFNWLVQNFTYVEFAADWILYCEALDDTKVEDRQRGLAFDMEMVRRTDEIWLVGGRISTGMASELAYAQQLGKSVTDLIYMGDEPPNV